MKHILTTTALASALVLGTFAGATIVKAQDAGAQECIGEQCPGAGGGMKGGGEGRKMKAPGEDNQGVPGKRLRGSSQDSQVEDQSGDQVIPRKKRVRAQQDNDNVDVDVDVRSRSRVSEGKWRYDPDRHHRRRSKDATFRFYFGGYWYPEPYWEVYSLRPRYRVSCGEGRAIVAERFNRVRVVECRGQTYTYLGRRSGDTWRILLNARTGRIVDRDLI